MNLLIREKKEYFDTFNSLTGKWGTDDKYLVRVSIEYYDDNWNPTGFGMSQGESVPLAQNLGTLKMFPNQWDEFRSILEIGVEAREDEINEIRWIDEDKEDDGGSDW